MAKINHKIVRSVSEIKKTEWDSIFGDIPESYDFFLCVEESKLEGFSFSYILIYDNSDIALIAPLFTADFNLDIAVSGIFQEVIKKVRKIYPRFLILKTLFCGSPFGENGILGLNNNLQDKYLYIYNLAQIIKKLCSKKRIPFIIFKDFTTDDSLILSLLENKGFFEVESFPSVTTELNFNSLDEYLKSLKYSARKDLRRKIRKTNSETNIEVKVTDNVENVISQVYHLYLNTYDAGSIKFEKLTPEFFLNVSKFLPGESKFFLYYVDEKLSAFNLCFLHKDTLIDKFIGFDYDIARKYNLYFYSWCYNIEWCLKKRIRYYQVGQTDYSPKLRLGGKLIPLYAYIKHNNWIINFIIRLLTLFLKPDNFDESIKNNA